MQNRSNSSALAMDLHLFYIKALICVMCLAVFPDDVAKDITKGIKIVSNQHLPKGWINHLENQ